MRKLMTFGAVTALLTLGACRDAGDNRVEVDRPTVGRTKDTVTMPTINLPDSIVVPTVKIGRDTIPVRRP